PHVGRNLHPGACEAARAAVCAQWAGRFSEMHDALFGAQGKLMAGAGRDSLLALGEEVGLSAPTLAACLADASSLAQLGRDIDEGRALGVPGTPAWVLNGRPLFGALTRGAHSPVDLVRSVIKAGLWQD
ncbi:MAG: DsbA family protein, partial [Deltaproteobacteria bacterium]|nr:DsbA family protein [Deltaproteobacteria bacterium]